MRYFLPFIVTGITDGTIYALVGAGLVLTYKTSGVLNFGYGAIATVAAYLFYFLHYRENLSWIPSFVIAVLVIGPVLGLGMEFIGRTLSRQGTTLKIVGTVGLILFVQGLGTVLYGPYTTVVGQFLPKGGDEFQLFGVYILYSQLVIFVFGLACVAGLFFLFHSTRMGVSMRAAVDDVELLTMQGTSARLVRSVAWIIGCLLAAASGVLILPFLGLNATTLTLLVVQAFGAAALGLFSSIPLTFLGGLAIGIVGDLSQKYVLQLSWLAGVPPSIPFVILLIAILLARRRLSDRSPFEFRPRLQRPAPAVVRGSGATAVLVLLVVLPFIVGSDKIVFLSVGLSQSIMLLSLGLLVRNSGQVSLCQATFAAIGAVVFAQLTGNVGMPWLVALLVASLIAAPIGALLAYPASRLSGVFLALTTLGFGIMVQQLLYGEGFMFTTLSDGRGVPRPSFASSNLTYYYMVLAFMVVISVFILVISRARLGRSLRGIADAPVACTALGLNANVTRVIVFALSASIAAIGGILYTGSIHVAVSTDPYFQPLYSLTLLAILAIAPGGAPWYAVPAGVAAVLPGYLSSPEVPNWLAMLFGFSAVAVSMQGGPPPMPMWLRRAIDRIGDAREEGKRPTAGPAVADYGEFDLGVGASRDARVGGLEVRHVLVRFGGLIAVNDVTLSAPQGRITGLIGPNGAGKTSLFDACSGLNTRFSGQMFLHDVDISRFDPSKRGRLGLGRTFQGVQLVESASVAQNLALGREAALAGRGLRSQILALPEENRVTKAAVIRAMEICGILDLSEVQVDIVPIGQRKLVEVARCLAGSFDVLLLDEPSAGLNQHETAELGEVLRRAVVERNAAVLLVEHDMSLVMDICDHIYVLDHGRIIFDGPPTAAVHDPAVQEAYLGTGLSEEVEATALQPHGALLGPEGAADDEGRQR